MKIKIFCFFILLSSSQVFANNQNIEPGNLISMLIDENHIENNKYSYIYHKNQKYLIAAASFSMHGKVLNINNKKFTVGSKNFGESRIVIKDQSKVELSQEDSNRAYLESQEIKKALKIYSKENYLFFIKISSSQIVNTESYALFQFRAKDTCICNISSLSVSDAVSISIFFGSVVVVGIRYSSLVFLFFFLLLDFFF